MLNVHSSLGKLLRASQAWKVSFELHEMPRIFDIPVEYSKWLNSKIIKRFMST